MACGLSESPGTPRDPGPEFCEWVGTGVQPSTGHLSSVLLSQVS